MRSLAVELQSDEAGRITLLVTGELNCFTTDLLTAGVDNAVRDSRCTVIELDIAGVRFLDSAGIRGLLQRRTAAERAGRRLVLSNPTDWVRQILRATGLLAMFGLPEADGQATARPAGLLYQPREMAALRAESAALREDARQAREQAAATQRNKRS